MEDTTYNIYSEELSIYQTWNLDSKTLKKSIHKNQYQIEMLMDSLGDHYGLSLTGQ